MFASPTEVEVDARVSSRLADGPPGPLGLARESGYSRPMKERDDAIDDQDEDTTAPPSDEATETEASDEDYGPPFESRSFGGELVWAEAAGYTAKILRVRPGEVVIVSTKGRRDMVIMLTGGRAALEIRDGDNVDRVELMPMVPLPIEAGRDYRLNALTDVELLTIFTIVRAS